MANRPENPLQPKTRGVKKTVKIAQDIVQRYREASEQIRFKILVWGPGPGHDETKKAYEKREQIKAILISKGMDAFFGEEIKAVDDRGRPIPLDVSEMFQAQMFDLVINVAVSFGSVLEAQKISTKLSYRCLIWLPETAKRGFASGMIRVLENLGLPPLYFDESVLKSCVLTLASEDWIDGLRSNEIGLDLEEKMIQEMRITRTGSRLQ